MNNALFESDNLTLREFIVDDSGFIFELLNTAAWKKFIGDRNIDTIEDAVNYILNGPQALYAKYGYGLWLVELKGTAHPVGMCGLVKRDYLDHPDLGFAFLPGFEGKGLAYEACMATLAYVQNNYPLDCLYAVTITENVRSQRLLERCGFIQTDVITPPGDVHLLLYRLGLQ